MLIELKNLRETELSIHFWGLTPNFSFKNIKFYAHPARSEYLSHK